MKKHFYSICYWISRIVPLVIILCFYHSSFSQSNGSSNILLAKFDSLPVILKQGEIISNQLMVINNDKEKEISFRLNITPPDGWKFLGNLDRIYSIPSLDTFFIPVRIIPHGKVLGNTKYLIFAYLINEREIPISSAYFLVEKQKIIDWSIDVAPDPKLYLKNGESEKRFSIDVFNTGNEMEELELDLVSSRKDRLIIKDTNDRILKSTFYSFKLKPLQDSIFYFKASYSNNIRNFRFVDTENYKPNSNIETQKYSIYAHSRESAKRGNGSRTKSKKIDIISLPNIQKVNPFGFSALPVTMDINVSNILGVQPIMNTLFFGRTMLENGAQLNYNSQLIFSTPYANKRVLTNAFLNVGYYYKNYSVLIGNVGGAGGGGKGIKGTYNINDNLTVGAFVARGSGLFKAQQYSAGANVGFRLKNKFTSDLAYSHVNNWVSLFKMNFLTLNASYQFLKNHSIFAGTNLIQSNASNINGFSGNSYTVSSGYSGKFLQGKLGTGIGISYSRNNFNNFSAPARTITHNSQFRPKKDLILRLTNNYNKQDSINPVSGERIVFSNLLNINGKIRNFKFNPAFFYNITELSSKRFHSRGIGYTYSYFEPENNKLISMNLRVGYNKALDAPINNDKFFLQSFIMAKYRVWTGNVRYTYGNISAQNNNNGSDGSYPQSIAASISKQHQFANDHFLLNANGTYRYVTQTGNHSFGVTPQIYYFLNSGWRFYLTPGIYFIYRSGAGSNIAGSESKEDQEKLSTTVNINFGIRKSFGIPIPWKKKKHPTLTFISFIDHNGNNKQDKGEVSLENVVIRFGEWEMLTNERGMAYAQNVYNDSSYVFSAFSLEELNGYFPNIPNLFPVTKDTLVPVPFVKGTKIYGGIFIDREKAAIDAGKSFDLGGIRINALNGKSVNTLTDTKGEFSLYVPYGKYVISIDEEILGNRFTLLQNNIELMLDRSTESIYVTFYLVEKRRKINVKKFDQNGEATPSNSGNPIIPKLDSIKQNNTNTDPQIQPGDQDTSGINNGPKKKVNWNNSEPADKDENVMPGGNQDQINKNPVQPNVNNAQGAESDSITNNPGPNGKFTVQPGNTIEDIAKAYEMTPEEVRKANNLGPDENPLPGTVLDVKLLPEPPKIEYEINTITIRKGESLYSIYRKYGMTVEEIMELNGLTSDALTPGQVIKVRKVN